MQNIESIIAIDKFIALATNFESDYYEWTAPWNSKRASVIAPIFITETKWNCDTDHMVEKWLSCQNSTDNYGWLIKFYCNLDATNRVALCNWINERYNDCMTRESTIKACAL